MRAIPEHLGGVFMTRRYTNPRLPYLYLISFCYDNDDDDEYVTSQMLGTVTEKSGITDRQCRRQ